MEGGREGGTGNVKLEIAWKGVGRELEGGS